MIIYKTTNLINGKFYIGQDYNNNPDYLGSGKLLKRAIKKYGQENFIKEVIEICDSKEQLNEREIFWINETNAKTLGYNIADGGHGGNTYTEETKKRVSEMLKGREVSKETVEKRLETRSKNPEKYKLSEERKIQIGNFHRGKIISEQQKRLVSEKMKTFDNFSPEFLEMQKGENKSEEKNPMWGKRHTIETRKKMSEAHKKNPVRYWLGKKHSAESNEKRRQASLRFRHSEEYKKSIRGEGNYFYGKTHSKEARQKISESRKSKTPEQKLETYIKFHVSRYGSEPCEEKKAAKLAEYKRMKNACSQPENCH